MNSKSNPLISIITSSYNAANTIEATIQSILNQTYVNIEYIVIDGNSSDGTADIIAKYANHLSYWISEDDNGIYHAWNKGLKQAKGDWIGFLGADDIYYPDAIQNYVELISKSSNDLDFVSSRCEYVDKDLNFIKVLGQRWKWTKVRDRMVCAHCGALHSKNLFIKYGIFDESFKSAGDYALLLKAGPSLKADFLNKITLKMREGGISSSQQNINIYTEALAAKIRSKNVPYLLAYLRFFMGLCMYNLRRILQN